MSRPRSPATPRRSRVLLLVAVLTLAVGLVGVLAFEAYRAGRDHRRVSEQVLGDYVRFAAREVARYSSADLRSRAFQALDFLACGTDGRSAAAAMAALDAAAATEVPVVAEAYLRFDPADRRIVEAAGELEDGQWAAIEAALADVPRGSLGGFLGVEAGGRPMLLAWRLFGQDVAVPVHAIVIADDTIAGILEDTFGCRPLLPNALVKPEDQREYLTAELRLADGTVLHRAGDGPGSSFFAEEPLELTEAGDVLAVASLATGAADRLVIGGLPRSRLPLLAGLLCLVVGLVAVAVHQMRREYELTRLRDAFVSGVSHELRTPLAQIRLFAETLRHGRVRNDDETERSLAIVDEEAARLSYLVDNLLTFNRAGRMGPSVEVGELALAPFVADTVERFAPLVRTRGDRFEVEVPEDLIVSADREALSRVLTNLLDNAVKYGKDGQTIRVGATVADGRARLFVDDEGAGVRGADRGRIWDPFVRGEHRGQGATGTGIGLSVVRELTAAMGGSAWAEDAPGGGARFVIELAVETGADAPGLEPSRAPA